VLLLKHRFWKDCPWGTPSGYLERGESVEDGFAREVREETGLAVRDVKINSVNSGFRLRLEISVIGRLDGSAEPTVDGVEVEQARFFTVDELPPDLRTGQRKLIDAAVDARRS
jgi:NADH pyrophosphatase NudC (nudix superfamily)